MAKTRNVPRAFQGTRAIPGQYTTDPDIATPEQISSIGESVDKARQIGRGRQMVSTIAGDPPLVTQLDGIDTQDVNAPGSVRRSRNRRVRGSGSIKTSTSFRNLVMGNVGVSINPTVGLNADDLPE